MRPTTGLRPSPPRRRRWGPVAALLALLAVVATVVGVLASGGRLSGPDTGRPRASTSPSASPAPGRPTASPTPVLTAAGPDAPAPTSAGLVAALGTAVRDPALGRRLSYVVLDATTGGTLAAGGPDTLVTPASTAKILTAVAVLRAAGPDARIETRVVTGAAPGEVVLVGGGDPTLSRRRDVQAYRGAATLPDLAAAVRRALGTTRVTRVVVDGSRYTGPATAPGWRPAYVTSGNVAPITAVMVDGGRLRPQGRTREPAPDLSAGRQLAALLGAPRAPVVRGAAPTGAGVLATVRSAPVPVLVEQMLVGSDNVLAEALARLVAVERHEPVDFAGAASAVRATLSDLDIDVDPITLVDGSGLSRSDALRPALLARLLALAGSPQHPELRPVLSGLPVAGYVGTLARRYHRAPALSAAGLVRAKTGTLNGVSALAGVVTDADGRLLAFAFAADRLPGEYTLGAEAALDRIAAVLARCGCR